MIDAFIVLIVLYIPLMMLLYFFLSNILKRGLLLVIEYVYIGSIAIHLLCTY